MMCEERPTNTLWKMLQIHLQDNFAHMQHLLLLHGAIGAKDQMQPLAECCSPAFMVHMFNFSGHGGGPMPADAFSFPLFATEVLDYLDRHQISSVNIFGYSMGGYVAMYLAKHFPGRVQKVMTLATKFYWDEKIAEKEINMLNANFISETLPIFARQLAQRHAPNDWKQVLDKTKIMLLDLGRTNCLELKDYGGIQTPCLLMLGDKDKMVTKEETEAVYKALPNASMHILPDTSHPIERINLDMVNQVIVRFIVDGS